MAWSFSPGRAVYLQIAERIRRYVITGEYKAGEQIPSVRALAFLAAVNPNTVQRAFSELEDEGIIESRGTLGRFVTEDKEKIESARRALAEEMVCRFAEEADELAIPNEMLFKMIEETRNNGKVGNKNELA